MRYNNQIKQLLESLHVNQSENAEDIGTIEDFVKAYYAALNGLRMVVKKQPNLKHNEHALMSTQAYEKLKSIIEDEDFQTLISCGVETYMHGDIDQVLQDVIEGN